MWLMFCMDSCVSDLFYGKQTVLTLMGFIKIYLTQLTFCFPASVNTAKA